MIAALVPSIVLFARHGRRARKMGIPFAPFLAFGGIVALFFGDAMLDAYLASSSAPFDVPCTTLCGRVSA